MKVLIDTPAKVFTKVREEKIFPSSSTKSSTISWRRGTWFSKSSNRSCSSLLYASSRRGKVFCSLPWSNSEVGLGAETAKTKVLKTDGSKVASLRLELEKECQYGEYFLVVGDDPVLGSWDPLKAIPLTWSDAHIWTVDLELPIGKTIQYKFIWKLVTGDIIWQSGPNRTVCLEERQNVLIVREDWEDVNEQQFLKQENPISNTTKNKTSEAYKSLVIYEEGSDLVPTEEVLIKELENSILASTSSGTETPVEVEGESLINYDEGHVLVPGLTAQLITEETLAKELQKSILANSPNGVVELMLNDDANIPPW